MKTKHTPMKLSLKLLAALVSASFCLQASAATITVMNTSDSGAGSLRQAISDSSSGDTINFDSSLNGQTITLTSGELLIFGFPIAKNLTITGPGADQLAVNGNAASRVFHIISGAVTISGLTITNGNGDLGGGIWNQGGTLTIANSTLSGNSCTTVGGSGGGICNTGFGGSSVTLTIINSTLSGNSATSNGGGIYNAGTLTIINSTLSANSASATYGNGGGILTFGTLTITNSTLSGNSAGSGYDGGIGNYFGTVEIGNTILKTGVLGQNIISFVGLTSLGYNLRNDAAGGDGTTGPGGLLNATGDQRNTDPLLGPLQNNGGPTFTHTLLVGSPAIDAGDPNFDPNSFTPPLTTDQRGSGFARVANGRIDIGAFEVQQPPYAAQVQQPINSDGSSVFSVRRGVVPVKFTLTLGGVATCALPPATIALTRTAGGTTGAVDESVYSGSADTGSNFRIDSCQYVYNLSASTLGVGTYRVDIKISGSVVGNATFQLQ
jgi:hypothetical protein